MKVLVNRAALVEALGLASSVVLSRTPKPVLTCVKLVAGKEGGGGNEGARHARRGYRVRVTPAGDPDRPRDHDRLPPQWGTSDLSDRACSEIRSVVVVSTGTRSHLRCLRPRRRRATGANPYDR